MEYVVFFLIGTPEQGDERQKKKKSIDSSVPPALLSFQSSNAQVFSNLKSLIPTALRKSIFVSFDWIIALYALST
jgi:hypothetical protein